jgi:hypothetical protein
MVVVLLALNILGLLQFPVDAAQFKARLVDGLGRPVADAAVEIELGQQGKGTGAQARPLQLSSDTNGIIAGDYDEKGPSTSDWSVDISKPGYSGYTTVGLRAEYVLNRSFSARDIRRISRLSGEIQKNELRSLLTGEYKSQGAEDNLQEMVFLYYREFAPGLRELLGDPVVGAAAAQLLSFIGVPEDMRLIVQQTAPRKTGAYPNRWAYSVACSLLDASTDEEWAFLLKCATNGYNDPWVDRGAIQTLKLIASPRSLETLKQAARVRTARKETITEAMDYIQSSPPPVSGNNLSEVAKSVAQVIKIGKWQTNEPPRLNDEGDMALVDCIFVSGDDRLTYTATFHNVSGVWKLRGIRETVQALMARPPSRKAFIGTWEGYSESHLEFARLELSEDGTGLFVLSELPDSPPSAYRVMQWSQRDWNLDLGLEAAQAEAEPIALKNVALGFDTLDGEIYGNGWERKMTLVNLTEFERRATAVKKSMDGLLNNGLQHPK